jgi:hypothetical protein
MAGQQRFFRKRNDSFVIIAQILRIFEKAKVFFNYYVYDTYFTCIFHKIYLNSMNMITILWAIQANIPNVWYYLKNGVVMDNNVSVIFKI